MILHGKPVPEGTEEPHAVTLQKHLLGYEFPDTLMFFTKNKFYMHATAKKRECWRRSLFLAVCSATCRPRAACSRTGRLCTTQSSTLCFIFRAHHAAARHHIDLFTCAVLYLKDAVDLAAAPGSALAIELVPREKGDANKARTELLLTALRDAGVRSAAITAAPAGCHPHSTLHC